MPASRYDRLGAVDISQAVKRITRPRLRNTERAIDYLDNNIRPHVEADLRRRFPSTQEDSSVDEDIEPLYFGLTQKFIEEAATAYAYGVSREIVGEDGEVDEELTEAYNAALDSAKFDRQMGRVEQITLLVKSCGVWAQLRHGKLKLRVIYPHKIHGVLMDEDSDPGDLNEYRAVLINLSHDRWAYVSPSQVAYMSGSDPSSLTVTKTWDNKATWEQMVEAESGRSEIRELPLMPFALATYRDSADCLIPESDPEVADINHEINIAWSSIMDTLRYQSFAQPFITRGMSGGSSRRRAGVRFPISLGAGESFGFAYANVNFAQIADTLQTVSQVAAVSKNQSPNDYSLTQQAPSSGFAKLLDSMPKLDERERNVERWSSFEEEQLFPIVASLLIRNGDVGEEIRSRYLRVKFKDKKIPRPETEKNQALDWEFKHNLNSPVRYLAEERGISLDEAKAIVEENREMNQGGQQQEQQPPSLASRLSGAVRGAR